MSTTVNRLLRQARSGRFAVSRADAAPRVPKRQPRKLGLRGALTAVVLGTVALTALLIHLFWSFAARHNVGDVVDIVQVVNLTDVALELLLNFLRVSLVGDPVAAHEA